MDHRDLVRDDETLDAALGGALRIIQPVNGYRFSVDALLLAGFASRIPAERIVDLGCGSGVVGLALLEKLNGGQLLGLDIQKEFAQRAARAAQLNGRNGQAQFQTLDIRSVPDALPGGGAELVVCNPPYRPVGAGRLSPNPSVAVARHELEVTLPDIFRAARHLLAMGGSCCLVYPAYRLGVLLASCREAGLVIGKLRMVHPRLGDPASLVLLRAVKGRYEEVEVASPLILHGPSGGEKYSEEARRILGLA